MMTGTWLVLRGQAHRNIDIDHRKGNFEGGSGQEVREGRSGDGGEVIRMEDRSRYEQGMVGSTLPLLHQGPLVLPIVETKRKLPGLWEMGSS